MENLLEYFSAPADRDQPLTVRCVRALSVLASVWLLLGQSLTFFFSDGTRTGHRLHLLGAVCFVVAAALYSVTFTLHTVFKRHGEGR